MRVKKIKNDDSYVWNLVKTSKLPSRGLPYGIMTSIKWRSLLCLEIKKILGVGMEREDFLEIYEKVLDGIDIQELSPEDTKYLQLLVALQTTPDMEWRLKVECKHGKCKTMNKFSVTPSSFEFNDIKAKSLPIKLQWNKDQVITFDIIRNKDLPLIEQKVEEGRDLELTTLAFMARDFDFETVYDMFAKCSAEEMQLLAIIDDLLAHEIKPHVVTCSGCKKNIHVDIGLEVADIAPFRKYEEVDRSRISFGD